MLDDRHRIVILALNIILPAVVRLKIEVSDMRRAAKIGALAAIIGAFPVSALFALMYRFPIPFAGYESGLGAAMRSLVAVLMYGIGMGGFVVLAVLGAGLAAIASRCLPYASSSSQNPRAVDTAIGVLAGVLAAVIVVGLLANWDHLYGPW